MPHKTDHREWAREHMVGVENETIPSFTADLSQLDEDGIRLDVRQAKAHGFFSTLVAAESGMTFGEAKRMLEIVVDEAGSDLLVSCTLLFDSFEQNEAALRHCEAIGVHSVLFGYPANWYPQSLDEVFDTTKQIIDSTDLAVVLYPSPFFGASRFSPSWFPPEVMQRLVNECPNIVGIKVGELGLFAECHHRFGDKILLNSPIERDQPMLVPAFGVQWMGAGCYEVFQSPDKPYLVDYHRLLREGEIDRALELYWRVTPARLTFERQHFQTVFSGTYNWTQHKYYQWCTGGNGGLTRQPAMKVLGHEKIATQMAFRAIGVDPSSNEEEFYMGRTAYARHQQAQREKEQV